MSLEDVTKLVSAGKYEKALDILNHLPSDIFILNPHTYNLLKGHLLAKQGQFEQALAVTKKIIQISKEEEDYSTYINASLIFADALVSLYRPLEGIEVLLESEAILLNKLSRRSLSNQKLIGQLYSLLGSSYWIKGDYDLAIGYLDKSIDLGKRYGFSDVIAESYFRKGVHFQSKKDDQSLEFLNLSAEIFKKLGNDFFLSDVYHYLGLYYRSIHDYEEALKYFLRSSKIRNYLGNQLDLGWSYHRIGTTYKDLGNFNQALTYLQRSLELREKLNNRETIAQSYEEIGDIYFYQGELELALTNLYWAYSVYTKIESNMLIASVKNKIGRVFGARGDLDTAIIYFNDALELFEKIDDKLGIPWTQLFIGQTKFFKTDLDDAEIYLKKALNKFTQLDNKMGSAFAYLLIGKLSHHLKIDKTEENYNKAIKLFRETHNIEGITESLISKAILLYNESDNSKSEGLFKEAEKLFMKYGKEHFGLIERLYRLIMFAYENNVKNIDQLINLFKKLSKKHKRNARIQQRLQLIESFELIRNNTPKQLDKAKKILEKIILDDIIDFETTLMARINIITVDLNRIRRSDGIEFLENAEKSILDAVQFIDRRNLISWLAQINIQQAKLKFLKLEYSQGIELLKESLEISKQHNLNSLTNYLQKTLEKITDIFEKSGNITDDKLIHSIFPLNNLIIGVGQVNVIEKMEN